MPKKAHVSKPSLPKKAIIPRVEIYSRRPKWGFSHMNWTFSLENLDAKTCKSGVQLSSNTPKVECCFHLLTNKLKDYESSTWKDIILNDARGSHFIALADLKLHNRAMYDKFAALAIEGALDEPFSLRLESKARLWGIILSDGTFEAVFYDPEHKGWPIEKKNT